MFNGISSYRLLSFHQSLTRVRPQLIRTLRPFLLHINVMMDPSLASTTSHTVGSSSASSSSASFTTTSTVSKGGPIQQMITQRIQEALQPIHFEIENESYKHSVPPGSESHFKLFIVSSQFEKVSLIDRHRLVNTIVKGNDTNLPVHALSISAKTPAQWAAGAKIQDTPNCKGGSKHESGSLPGTTQ